MRSAAKCRVLRVRLLSGEEVRSQQIDRGAVFTQAPESAGPELMMTNLCVS